MAISMKLQVRYAAHMHNFSVGMWKRQIMERSVQLGTAGDYVMLTTGTLDTVWETLYCTTGTLGVLLIPFSFSFSPGFQTVTMGLNIKHYSKKEKAKWEWRSNTTERRVENLKKRKRCPGKISKQNANGRENAVFVYASEQCNHTRKSAYRKDGDLKNSVTLPSTVAQWYHRPENRKHGCTASPGPLHRTDTQLWLFAP